MLHPINKSYSLEIDIYIYIAIPLSQNLDFTTLKVLARIENADSAGSLHKTKLILSHKGGSIGAQDKRERMLCK